MRWEVPSENPEQYQLPGPHSILFFAATQSKEDPSSCPLLPSLQAPGELCPGGWGRELGVSFRLSPKISTFPPAAVALVSIHLLPRVAEGTTALPSALLPLENQIRNTGNFQGHQTDLGVFLE